MRSSLWPIIAILSVNAIPSSLAMGAEFPHPTTTQADRQRKRLFPRRLTLDR
jgi:hypothetical protein